MQAIIDKQYKEFYKNIFNEWLENIRQQNHKEDDIHLSKAKEALNVFCKHVDDYLSESLKSKINTHKQAEIKEEQKIQDKEIKTPTKKIQNKSSDIHSSIIKPSESKISICSQETTIQKYESSENSPVTNQASFNLFSNLFGQNKSGVGQKKTNSIYQNSSPIFSSVSTQANTSSIFKTPSIPPKIHNSSNQSLFSIPLNNSLFSQIIDLSISHSDSGNKTFLQEQQSSKQKINNFSLFQNPSPANPFLKKINPATNQTIHSIDYYEKSDSQQQEEQKQSDDLQYIQNSQQEQYEEQQVDQSKQNTILLSYVTEISEDDVEQADASYLHYQHIGKYISNYLSPQRCQQYLGIINQYYPSNYFHVGPRYELLSFLSTLSKKIQLKQQPQPLNSFNLDINLKQFGQKISQFMTVDKIMNIRQISSQYYSSNYFHVGPRRTMLEYVRSLVRMSMDHHQYV